MACFDPDQYKTITDGLLDAFPNHVSLANMLVAVAGTPKVQRFPNSPIARNLRNINRITQPSDPMPTAIYNVLQAIEAADLCAELVMTAHMWNPFNKDIETVHREFMRVPAADPAQESELERLITITREQFLNPVAFAERFGPIRFRVCRVEVGRKESAERAPQATAFLVGPDLVFTNHHVIAPVLNGEWLADRFLCAFDRAELADGSKTSGPTAGLLNPADQSAWLVAMSPTSDLDYALLRLDTPLGEKPIHAQFDAGASRRGWFAISEVGSIGLNPGDPLFIFQHPDGLPLRLDVRDVGELTEKRVTYSTNTMRGSSGSPCFDRELRLVALHSRGPAGQLNQGIPFSAIVNDLDQKGLLGLLSLA